MNANASAKQCNPQLSLAAFPGVSYTAAMSLMQTPIVEDWLGRIGTNEVQIVPQLCREQLTDEIVNDLTSRFPETQFRLHANVRVLEKHLLRADISAVRYHANYFKELARLSRLLKAPAYTAHAGRREFCSFEELIANTRSLSDLFGCPVAVEGHYPTPRDPHAYHVDSWESYRAVFASGVPYVLDLSHLNIVAHYERKFEAGLVSEMLACDRCLEVHLSDNDGRADQHAVLEIEPTWWPNLRHVNRKAVVFSEGNQLKKLRNSSELHPSQLSARSVGQRRNYVPAI